MMKATSFDAAVCCLQAAQNMGMEGVSELKASAERALSNHAVLRLARDDR